MPYGPDMLFILALILLNGFFAMAELAVVSARRTRLRAMVHKRIRGAAAALAMNQEPARFLSTVQVGITGVGIFAGVFGGEQLAPPLERYLAGFPAFAPHAEGLAIAAVVSGITYASIVIGELVPKQLAIRHAERIAVLVAPAIALLARLAVPIVFVLEVSSRALLAVFGARGRRRPQIIEEEVKALVADGVRQGVLAPQEKEMISGVMRLADWKVRAIKTPAIHVEWLDLDADESEQRRRLLASVFSRLVVARGGLNRPLGIVHTKDLLSQMLAGQPFEIRAAIRDPIYVDNYTSALRVLELFKRSPVHMAVVLDESATVDGVLTTFDILKAIVGGFPGAEEGAGPQAVQRRDGSWLMGGELHLDAARDMLGLPQLAASGDYHTLAGFMLAQLERIPAAGEHFEWNGFRFEVADMDGAKIDKALVTRAEPHGQDANGQDAI
ncbi:MAG: hemolysin family protein [Chromatiales bacterium]